MMKHRWVQLLYWTLSIFLPEIVGINCPTGKREVANVCVCDISLLSENHPSCKGSLIDHQKDIQRAESRFKCNTRGYSVTDKTVLTSTVVKKEIRDQLQAATKPVTQSQHPTAIPLRSYAYEDFRRKSFVGKDFHKANFRSSDLRRAVLDGANFRDADLAGTDLRYATLKGTQLHGANLNGAYLRRSNLQGAQCVGANFQGADLRRADLTFANLQKANFQNSDLRGAKFGGADLREAKFEGADTRMTEPKGLFPIGRSIGSAVVAAPPKPAPLQPIPPWNQGSWLPNIGNFLPGAQIPGIPTNPGIPGVPQLPGIPNVGNFVPPGLGNLAGGLIPGASNLAGGGLPGGGNLGGLIPGGTPNLAGVVPSTSNLVPNINIPNVNPSLPSVPSAGSLIPPVGSLNPTGLVAKAGMKRSERRLSNVPIPLSESGSDRGGQSVRCICDKGWSGTKCTRPVCLNGGQRARSRRYRGTFRCKCRKGFTGNLCQFRKCNRGRRDNNTNKCVCQRNWTGMYCDIRKRM